MTISDIIRFRLHNLLVSSNRFASPAETVSWLGAVQAQDYFGAKWSLGLRITGLKEQSVDDAIANRSIVRTWPMRGTLHFVAAEDARWMLKLLTPRIIAGSAGRHRQLELDDKTFDKSKDLLISAMQGGKQFMRNEVYKLLQENGISTSGQRGMHIIGFLAQSQILCHGSHNDKQPTYVLMDDWVPKTAEMNREEALHELAIRYFKSHGPATISDFVWWTGLRISEAKQAINLGSSSLKSVEVDGNKYLYHEEMTEKTDADAVFLLPGFDEYILGYTDRNPVVDKIHAPKIIPGKNGVFAPTIISNGKVEGTWKRTLVKDAVQMNLSPFGKLSLAKKKAIEVQCKEFAKFLSRKTVDVNWQ
ncbi:winged helix DNA-binding domain-containing protein [Dyadobacter sp. CY323]|uniref:winged helix DNA-binding domain-containing protein n=1 Tax=Dyadobacter sp. CY323 TaxID=2907302 RepID=UPI001F44B31A|nr:winged helix DNA-binding domain-containing protein [Dyadobacter sp. CY323]MCE6992324.1 winged helix DNA-binding domain-containing protein [Dyadobacter sp. CY323]